MITFMLSVDHEEFNYGSYKGSCIEHHETGISFNIESEGPLDDMRAIADIAGELEDNGFVVLVTSSWNDFLSLLIEEFDLAFSAEKAYERGK